MLGVCSYSFYGRFQLLGYQQPRLLCPCHIPLPHSIKRAELPGPQHREGTAAVTSTGLINSETCNVSFLPLCSDCFKYGQKHFHLKKKNKGCPSLNWNKTSPLFASGHENSIQYFLLLLFTRKEKRALFGVWAYNQNLYWHQTDSLVSICYLLLLVSKG